MGDVYLARDDNLQRQVALKLLPAHLTADAERLRRFRAEARAASSLNHPHILVIHLRLVDLDRMEWRDRAHFFAMAATLMRRILVDHARDRARDKRGGRVVLTSLDGKQIASASTVDVLALDEALDRLAAMDLQQSRIVELRFFGGLTIDETSEALDISPATVKREWTSAKAWLHQQVYGR